MRRLNVIVRELGSGEILGIGKKEVGIWEKIIRGRLEDKRKGRGC
jgi:hypothetical protein